MADVDWTDPCARAAALRKTYFELIGGERESSFTYMSNGVTNTVMYSRASLTDVKAELQKAEAECDAKNNGTPRPRRRAISFG